MLFDTISESTLNTNWDEIEPSKYEANLEGALMLVYENECNYNALMRAAGLSELKYYQETGGDLFVQEAGAFGGFLEKAKSFFKAVLDKIKALFKKFFMTINQFVMSDKQWIKKYEKDILRATNLKDMEFKGYTFKQLDPEATRLGTIANSIISGEATSIERIKAKGHEDWSSEARKDEDELNDYIEKKRGELLKGSSMNEAEFRDELKERLYGGDKELLEDSDINIRQQLQYIRDTKESTKNTEKLEKDVTKAITHIIKALDEKIKEFGKVGTDETTDKTKTDAQKAAISESKQDAIKALNQRIRIEKALSNNATVACGMICQAYKDRNRQAKAICIKAVSYNSKKKNESAVYSDPDDLFAGVTIR